MCAHHVARARISVVIGFLAFVSFLGIHQSASAQDLTATLENVVFDDGGTASGSFTYYYDPNPSQELLTMDSALITTTVGTAYAGTVYDYNDTYTIGGNSYPAFTGQETYHYYGGSAFIGQTNFVDIHYNPTQQDQFDVFTSTWPDAPGDYPLITSGIYQGFEAQNGNNLRYIISGDLIVSAPEPSTVALAGALASAALLRRRAR